MNNCDSKYKVCTYCVMDSAMSTLKFDEKGQCDCCLDAISRKHFEWWPNDEGKSKLDEMVTALQREGQGKRYDCMIGLSGGIDSAYLAHLAVRELNLKVLAVHVDAGWNSAAAVRNIESIVRTLDIDLHTHVVEWEEMRDIQLAYLKASVLNQDNPQDHAFFSTLYHTAIKYRINNFLSGVNYASENITPKDWGHPYMDALQIRAIHKKYGSRSLKTFPFMSFSKFVWHTRIRKTLKIHRPLDYLNYNKIEAQKVLEKNYNWIDYGGKHHESRFTKFYQEIYLPKKYGFDKRRLHLSSLIVSQQLTREAAINELEKPIVSEDSARRDLRFVAKKLTIKSDVLQALIESPPVSHLDYPNQLILYKFLVLLKTALRFLKQK